MKSYLRNIKKNLMKSDYKNLIYNNYHTFHTKKLYGKTNPDSIRKQFKYWQYFFSDFLPKNKFIKILDVGCGDGGFVLWLQEKGYSNTIGIDISTEMINLSKSMNIKSTFQDNMFDHLRINKNKYDLIFCRDVLEHLPKEEVVEILRLFNESLKASGDVIIQVPNGYSPNYGKIFYSDFTHETLFSESALNQITQVAGFNSLYIKEVTPVPHGFLSSIRFLLWKILKLKFQFYQLIENGYSRGFFSQNIIAKIQK